MLLLIRTWLGGLLLVSCGFWCGTEIVRRWHNRRCALEEIVHLMQQLLDAVQYRRLPADLILQELKDSGYTLLPLEQCICLQLLEPPAFVTREQASRFHSCMQEFGRQASQPQCEQLRQYLRYFQASTEAIQEKERAAAAVCPKIGLCVGAMAALALL